MIHVDAHLQTEAEREGLKATISKLESDHAAKVDRLEKDKAAFAEEVIGLEVRFASTPVCMCCSRGRVKTMTSLCTSQKLDMQNARRPAGTRTNTHAHRSSSRKEQTPSRHWKRSSVTKFLPRPPWRCACARACVRVCVIFWHNHGSHTRNHETHEHPCLSIQGQTCRRRQHNPEIKQRDCGLESFVSTNKNYTAPN